MLHCIITDKFTTTDQKWHAENKKKPKKMSWIQSFMTESSAGEAFLVVSYQVILFSCWMTMTWHYKVDWGNPSSQESSSAIKLAETRQIGSLGFMKGRVPGNIAEGRISIVDLTQWFRREPPKLSTYWILCHTGT